jgi:hypothetical protein
MVPYLQYDRSMKPATANAEPRAHHFAPQFWLAGFTDIGEKDGRLWVTDLKRRKQWPTNPQNAAHRRDFYRVSDPAFGDPVGIEKLFSLIENAVAPILKSLGKGERPRHRHEWKTIFTYIAVQYIRVPAFRPTVLRMADVIYGRLFADLLKTPEAWSACLKKLNIPADAPGASYEEMLEFERGHHYALSAETEWFLKKGFSAIETIVPCLEARHWRASISRPGGFISSDNPVALDGPRGKEVGFKTADIVIFPVSRYVSLYGANVRLTPLPMTYRHVAAHNTFTMMTADKQVYSAVPDFYWLDENGKYQTDWRLFSKERLLQSNILGLPIAVSSEP